MIQMRIVRASIKFPINLDIYYEYETSPKHIIHVTKFKSIT